MWVEAGFLKETELLSLCHVDSSMESHSTYVGPKPWERMDAAQVSFQLIPASFKHVLFSLQKHQLMDLATGSIGQGLGVACGMAYTGKYFDRSR